MIAKQGGPYNVNVRQIGVWDRGDRGDCRGVRGTMRDYGAMLLFWGHGIISWAK